MCPVGAKASAHEDGCENTDNAGATAALSEVEDHSCAWNLRVAP